MSFPNNNNYQGYDNFMNSQNAPANKIINNTPTTNFFIIINNSNINNNIIDPNKQIWYGAINNNQPPGTRNIPNIMSIMKTNQRSICLPLSHYKSYVISSPQNGINPNHYINGKVIS